MFYNIFKKTKKQNKKLPPIIIADIHEKNSLIIAELQSSDQIQLQIKPLKIADYLIGETAIERKTVSDLVSSMINKRLVQQLSHMKKYQKKLLLIEGNLNKILEENINISKALRGFILSIITNFQTPIIQTYDYQDSAKYLITLAKQQLKSPSELSFHSKIPKTIKEQKMYILESFPNIGPKTAKKLLDKFKTISNTINASNEELKEILKSKTEKFKSLINQ